MSYFLLWSLLIGPYNSSDIYKFDVLSQTPIKPLNITILTHEHALDKESARHSKVVRYELLEAPNFEFEKLYLTNVVSVTVVDWFDTTYPDVSSFPAIKWTKNSRWEPFPSDSFLASGSFIKTLCSIIYIHIYTEIFDAYEIELDLWYRDYEFRSKNPDDVPLPPYFNSWFLLRDYRKYNKTPEYSKLEGDD